MLGLFQRRRSRLRAVVSLLVSAAVVYLWMATPKAHQACGAGYPSRLCNSPGGWLAVRYCLSVYWPDSLLLSSSLPLSSRNRVAPDRVASWLVVPVVCLLVLLAWPETYPPKGMSLIVVSDMRELYARENRGGWVWTRRAATSRSGLRIIRTIWHWLKPS